MKLQGLRINFHRWNLSYYLLSQHECMTCCKWIFNMIMWTLNYYYNNPTPTFLSQQGSTKQRWLSSVYYFIIKDSQFQWQDVGINLHYFCHWTFFAYLVENAAQLNSISAGFKLNTKNTINIALVEQVVFQLQISNCI